MSHPRKEILWATVAKQAVIIGDYRYWWHRKFTTGKGVTVFGMLNPSKANKDRNDPTSRRCVQFARDWDTAAVVLVNLYAAISTEPDELLELDDPVGPRNWDYINEACELIHKEGGRFVIAWGVHRMAVPQAPAFLDFIEKRKMIPMHLGLTQGGQPRHPLYAPSGTELEEYGR